MDWRGSFSGCQQPVFEQQTITTLKESSTRVLVNTLKLAYDRYYNNVFLSNNMNQHKEIAMVFLSGVFCYLRGVGKLKNKECNSAVLPHFIANPILNALLESNAIPQDLIYLFCAQANLSLTHISISPRIPIQPVIFEALKQFNIQTIDLSRCSFVNNETILNLTQSESIQNSLVSLKIRGCINLNVLPDLSPLRALETLDISEIFGLEIAGLYQCYSLLDKLCLILHQLPKLRNFSTFSNGLLDCYSNYCLVNDNSKSKFWCQKVLSDSKLESLDISIYSGLELLINAMSVPQFLVFILSLPKLHSLDVSGWHITSQCFFNVFSGEKRFKFLGLLNIPAFIDSQSFFHDVTYFSEEVASLSTHNQILNSLYANHERTQFLNDILREIKSWLERNTFNVDKEFVIRYVEELIKILNYYRPGEEGNQLFRSEDIIDSVISCLALFTKLYETDFPPELRTRILKNCFIMYQCLSCDEKNEIIAEDLSKIVSTLISPDDLQNEELFPFYFAMLNFSLNLVRKSMSIQPIRRFSFLHSRALCKMAKQHAEFLNMFTLELPRQYLATLGHYHYHSVDVIVGQINIALSNPVISLGVHQFENLWGALRNLVYLCPENCYEYLSHTRMVLSEGYQNARKKQWQEVINLIHQSLENVIECWNLELITIGDTTILNNIEDFLLNKIIYFDSTDDHYLCSLSSIIIYLARMFETNNKILPEYLKVGLELVAENLPKCDLVHRIKRKSLRALLNCTCSANRNIVKCANWLIQNYLDQDFEYYSTFIQVHKQARQPEIIVID